MSDRCHNVRDRGVMVHIPGCMGCAAAGHENCTCTVEAKVDRLGALEARVARLEGLMATKVPLGPMPGDRHPQKSWRCKNPRDPAKHECAWRSCGCACHSAKEQS